MNDFYRKLLNIVLCLIISLSFISTQLIDNDPSQTNENKSLNQTFPNENLNDFKKPNITKKNAHIYGGIGGFYNELRKLSSTKELLEADHIPPISTYTFYKKFAKHVVKALELPAMSVPKEIHKQTKSWGSSNEAKEFRKKQSEHIADGNYKEAIAMSIEDYQNNVGSAYNKGLRQVLDAHRKIGTISKQEYKELTSRFNLKQKSNGVVKYEKVNGIVKLKTASTRQDASSVSRRSIKTDLNNRRLIAKVVIKGGEKLDRQLDKLEKKLSRKAAHGA